MDLSIGGPSDVTLGELARRFDRLETQIEVWQSRNVVNEVFEVRMSNMTERVAKIEQTSTNVTAYHRTVIGSVMLMVANIVTEVLLHINKL